jgi:cytochrome c-type biogenesis protein CcmH/NrfG
LAEITTVSNEKWTGAQVFGIAIVCLLLGVAGGWFLRKTLAHTNTSSVATANGAVSGPMSASPASLPAVPSPQELRQNAEAQATPLLEQLKSDPNNVGLLERIGNIYYDAQQYPAAMDYYNRLLNILPSNTSVRTDMGTAIWYTGNADGAIAEFKKALSYEPTKANTLFNLGIVLRQGKHDAAGAVTAWQKLLDTNSGYPNRDKVQQMISDAKTAARTK